MVAVVPLNTGEFIAGSATLTGAISGAAGAVVGGVAGLTAATTAGLTAMTSATIAQTAAVLGQETAETTLNKVMEGMKMGNWFMKWIASKMMKMRSILIKIIQFVRFMAMLARFWPIIKVFIAIIIITSNLLFYVIMIIAWIGAAILEVFYFILSLPPFIYILWFIFFLVADGIPFIVYSMVFLAILAFILVFCLILTAVDLISGGHLKILTLCQDTPLGWYKTPMSHMSNRFERGVMCSRPCKKNYVPDEIGTSCIKLPKESPSFCPQAQIMRFYSGVGKKDGKYIYGNVKTKGNMKYLSKVPSEREDILLNNYLAKKRFLENCNNPSNPGNMLKYDPITLNICANIESMANSDVLLVLLLVLPEEQTFD